jgi:hypothetical protein
MKKIAVNKWTKSFSKGRESVTHEERPGRPAISRIEENIAQSRQILRENRQLNVRSIAEQVTIDKETVRKISTEELEMRRCVQIWSQKSTRK